MSTYERDDRGWFERLTGFDERDQDYEYTQRLLQVREGALYPSGYTMGTLSLPSLAELRNEAVINGPRNTVRTVSADARELHSDPELAGAMFQVASQFNLLEMTSFQVSPLSGVTNYVFDHTQGPACAVAAGAAIIFRNYLVEIDGQIGQTKYCQIDTLKDIGDRLSADLGVGVGELWSMRNGYALCSETGLYAVSSLLDSRGEGYRDEIRSLLRIGLHENVQVTDLPVEYDRRVSQAFCSALPVRYSQVPFEQWEPFARLVLEAAYEATLLAAVRQKNSGGSPIVLLTRLGGGAFGNADSWIDDAISRALRIVEHSGLDIRLVSYGRTPDSMQALADEWAARG